MQLDVEAEDARQQRGASLIRRALHETKTLPTFVDHSDLASVFLLKMKAEALRLFAEAPFCEAVAEEYKLG